MCVLRAYDDNYGSHKQWPVLDTSGSDFGETAADTPPSGSWRFPKESLAEFLPACTHYRLELPDSIWHVWHDISGVFSKKIYFQYIMQ